MTYEDAPACDRHESAVPMRLPTMHSDSSRPDTVVGLYECPECGHEGASRSERARRPNQDRATSPGGSPAHVQGRSAPLQRGRAGISGSAAVRTRRYFVLMASASRSGSLSLCTTTSSISRRLIRALPIDNRPIATAPTATAPTARAPRANAPAAPATRRPVAVGSAGHQAFAISSRSTSGRTPPWCMYPPRCRCRPASGS